MGNSSPRGVELPGESMVMGDDVRTVRFRARLPAPIAAHRSVRRLTLANLIAQQPPLELTPGCPFRSPFSKVKSSGKKSGDPETDDHRPLGGDIASPGAARLPARSAPLTRQSNFV